jgi:hypothetical protein
MDGSGHSNGVPRSSDDVRSPSADTNSSTTYSPAWSGSGGGVTPELVLVDPELALAQRHTRKRKAAMSSPEPANTFPDPAQPATAPAPTSVTPPDTSMVDVPLGTLIFRAGLLGEEQLEGALQEGMRTGKRLGEVLLERGWLNERDLGQMLAGQKGLPFVDVNLSDVEPEALAALAEDDARRQVALPLFYEDGELVVAVGDPSNQVVLEGLRRELETDFQLVVAPHSQLRQVIDEAYSRPAPTPAPAAEGEGVLFPDLAPPAQNEAPAEIQAEPAFESEPEPEPEPAAQPDLGFASTVDPEPQAAAVEIDTPPAPVAEEKPFSGSTPTLLSRMLFPSVRHASQDTGDHVGDEPVAGAPVPTEAPELAEAAAPEPPEASAAAVEDFAELEVPAVPEMPIPSFEQPAETEPAPAEEPLEPAAAQVADQPSEPPAEHAAERTEQPVEQPTDEAAEQAADQSAEQATAEPAKQATAEPLKQVADQPTDEPPADEPAEEASAQSAEQATGEPAEQPAEDAQPPTHHVVVRLREGESLRIGEHGSAAEASAQAADAVAQISSAANNGTWPLFAGRYLSPDTIVSVDLVEASTEEA